MARCRRLYLSIVAHSNCQNQSYFMIESFQSVQVSGHYLGPMTDFFFLLLEIFYRHLCFILRGKAAFLVSESLGIHDHLSQFLNFPTW
jgi:hypothetical protein